MGLLKTFFTNCACPKGRMGLFMLKFMHEGNIYILRDSIIYDATGRKVRELK